MRLLNVDSLAFAEFLDDDRPPYVAASHRWLKAGEATFQNVRDRCNTAGEGYQKVQAFAKYLRKSVSHVKWLWLDSCCINKESAAELSEAINSMFEWYRSAELCLAYLADVQNAEDLDCLERSEWFKRGWTLQELLAPRTVVFVTKQWQVVGHKGGSIPGTCEIMIGSDLGDRLARVTGIPKQVLHDYDTSFGLSVDEKMKWMEGRITTRPEDMSYALYGILGISLGANYGERFEGAQQRLLAAVHQQESRALQQADLYERMTRWLSPPDPWTNHESARQLHEPETGAWLLQHPEYQAWKSGSTKYLWLYGSAGCGKTILCSTAIEDIRMSSRTAVTGQGIFYFSFSDSYKQTYRNLLSSLVAQLGWKDPGLSMLRQAFEKADRKQLGLDELRKILLHCSASFDRVFLHLDALDECPENDRVRQNVLNGIEELLKEAPNIQILATTRNVLDVRYTMERLGAAQISIVDQMIGADIQKFVITQLSNDPKLSRLDLAAKTLIQNTLVRRAGGMFRWVYCQLQELSRSKSTRPKVVRAALLNLPATLDETYERILTSISEDDRSYALKLLQWIAYAHRPLSLDELAEAGVIDLADDPCVEDTVDIEDRGGWEDTLEILAGLIITETVRGEEDDKSAKSHNLTKTTTNSSADNIEQVINKDTKVRLAHFSVKEYLESSRIRASIARDFQLDPADGHRHLTQSCLVYLQHYSNSPTTDEVDTHVDQAFPLLDYAANAWPQHAHLQRTGSSIREFSLLTSETSKRAWLQRDRTTFNGRQEAGGSALYYASGLGLETVVEMLVDAGVDINVPGGHHDNALLAASSNGHGRIAQMLINAGAEVNVRGPPFDCHVLHRVAEKGYEKIAQMLINAGADVNAAGGLYDNALIAATIFGYEGTVRMLIDAGANVNALAGLFGRHALHMAAERGHEEIARILIDAGADVNARGGELNALYAASKDGHHKVVRMLIGAGADVNARGMHSGSALLAASRGGHDEIVQMLLDAGADINAERERDGNVLHAAVANGHEKVAHILRDAGAHEVIHDQEDMGSKLD